jgi:hypothetical protein
MTKRPSKFELYTCCTIMWAAILFAAAMLAVRMAGGPAHGYDDGLILTFAALAWRKDIEVREVRWASQQMLLALAEEIDG